VIILASPYPTTRAAYTSSLRPRRFARWVAILRDSAMGATGERAVTGMRLVLQGPELAKEVEKASEPAKRGMAKAGESIEKTAEAAERLDKIRKSAEGAYGFIRSAGPVLITWGHTHVD